MNMFRSFHQVGVTVLIATHDAALLGGSQDRILALDRGILTV
jgi:cell division transport system ATP-binding protein